MAGNTDWRRLSFLGALGAAQRSNRDRDLVRMIGVYNGGRDWRGYHEARAERKQEDAADRAAAMARMLGEAQEKERERADAEAREARARQFQIDQQERGFRHSEDMAAASRTPPDPIAEAAKRDAYFRAIGKDKEESAKRFAVHSVPRALTNLNPVPVEGGALGTDEEAEAYAATKADARERYETGADDDTLLTALEQREAALREEEAGRAEKREKARRDAEPDEASVAAQKYAAEQAREAREQEFLRGQEGRDGSSDLEMHRAIERDPSQKWVARQRRETDAERSASILAGRVPAQDAQTHRDWIASLRQAEEEFEDESEIGEGKPGRAEIEARAEEIFRSKRAVPPPAPGTKGGPGGADADEIIGALPPPSGSMDVPEPELPPETPPAAAPTLPPAMPSLSAVKLPPEVENFQGGPLPALPPTAPQTAPTLPPGAASTRGPMLPGDEPFAEDSETGRRVTPANVRNGTQVMAGILRAKHPAVRMIELRNLLANPAAARERGIDLAELQAMLAAEAPE